MSADKPLETNTSVPPSGAGYRTLIPGGDSRSKPAGTAAERAPTPNKASQTPSKPEPATSGSAASEAAAKATPQPTKEDPHPDPTRFGDWEVKGRCIDF
jgi:hypothetical protein